MTEDIFCRVPKIALGKWVESAEYIDLYKVESIVQSLLHHREDVERYTEMYEKGRNDRAKSGECHNCADKGV